MNDIGPGILSHNWDMDGENNSASSFVWMDMCVETCVDMCLACATHRWKALGRGDHLEYRLSYAHAVDMASAMADREFFF